MSSVYHRYEAAVKLSNGRVVIYHNINTGLKKFHHLFFIKQIIVFLKQHKKRYPKVSKIKLCGAGGKLYWRLYSLIISKLGFSISRFNPYFLLFFYYF